MKHRHGQTQDPTRSWEVFDQLFDTAFKKSTAAVNSSPRTPAVAPTIDRAGSGDAEAAVPDYLSDSEVGSGPPTPPDYEYIDQIWAEVRAFKQRELKKEPGKIKSLEAVQPGIEATESPLNRLTEPSPREPKPSKRNPTYAAPIPDRLRPTRSSPICPPSSVKYRVSNDGMTMTAIFDMAGVVKKNVHISYQAQRLVVTWTRVNFVPVGREWWEMEEKEDKYSKTLALPNGTKFEQVHAGMDGCYLMVRYPNGGEVDRTEVVEPS